MKDRESEEGENEMREKIWRESDVIEYKREKMWWKRKWGEKKQDERENEERERFGTKSATRKNIWD